LVPQLIPNSSPSRLALTEDGKLALIGSRDGSVAVWQLEQRTLLGVLRAHEGEVVALATTGSRAWSIGRKDRGQQVTLCEIDISRVALRKCQGLGPGNVNTASVSRDGARAAIVLMNEAESPDKAEQQLVIVDLVRWKIRTSRRLSRSDRVTAIVFSPDGQTLASVGDNLVFMDADGKFQGRAPIDGVAIAFGASGVLVGRPDHALELRRVTTAELISRRAVASDYGLWNQVDDAPRCLNEIIAVGDDRFVVTTEHMRAYRAILVDMAVSTYKIGASHLTSTELGLLVATNETRTRTIAIIGSDLISFGSFGGPMLDRITLPHRGVTAAAYTPRGIWIGGTGSLAHIDPATAVIKTHDVPGVVSEIANNGEFAIINPIRRPSELWRLTDVPTRVRVLTGNARYRFICDRHPCRILASSGELTDAASGKTVYTLQKDACPRASVGYLEVVNDRLLSFCVEHSDYTITAFASSSDRRFIANASSRGQILNVYKGTSSVWSLLFSLDMASYMIRTLTFTPDGRSLLAGVQCDPPGERTPCDVWRIDIATQLVHRLGTHSGPVYSISVSSDGQAAVTTSGDGTARIWRLDGSAAVNFVLDGDNWILYSDDGIFDASRHGGTLIAAVRGDHAFPLEQLAAVTNLPDQLLTRMGFGRPDVRQYFAYRHALRTTALGLTLNGSSRRFDTGPQVTLDHLRRNGKFVELAATLTAPDTELARYQIWVNQVPLLPASDTAVHGRRATITHRIELTPGQNRIEVSAYLVTGLESLRAVQSVTYDAPDIGQLYVVTIGVSKYRDPSLDLGLADRDALDIAAIFGTFPRTHVLSMVNEQVTLLSLAGVREFLQRTTVNDTVVVFIAGHGIRSPDVHEEFLFVPYAFDRTRPRETAIPFSTLEGLIEGAAARRRLLLIDSCVSGDRDEGAPSGVDRSGASEGTRARVITLRSDRTASNSGPRLPPEYRLNRDRLIFQNGAHATGVVALGSSRWNEFSYESNAWSNGVFTAEIIRALKDPETDTNHDQRVSFDELVRSVRSGVAVRTHGLQHPTVRADNLDAGIWFPASSPP